MASGLPQRFVTVNPFRRHVVGELVEPRRDDLQAGGDCDVQVAEDREYGRLVVSEEIFVDHLERLDSVHFKVPAPARFVLGEATHPVIDPREIELHRLSSDGGDPAPLVHDVPDVGLLGLEIRDSLLDFVSARQENEPQVREGAPGAQAVRFRRLRSIAAFHRDGRIDASGLWRRRRRWASCPRR